MKRNCLILAVMSSLVALMLTISGCSTRSEAKTTAPLPSVNVVKLTVQDVPAYSEWVATLDGSVNAQIQPQVSGYLVKQDYEEGSYVRKGQVLFVIDPRPFQATLNQAKAQLAQAQARLTLAEVNVKRDTPLADQRAIAKSQLDTEVAGLEEAKANVQAAEAAVDTAELNLGFTRVHSLIDGIAGSATVQMGNLVSPASVLTTISKLDPVKVHFPISEQEYLQYADDSPKSSNTKVTAMALQLVLADGNTYPHKGRVAFTDRQVDPRTGTIPLVGLFPNPGNILRPGQFARVHALKGVAKSALLIPQRAVIDIQGTYQVAVVGQDSKVSMRKVKLGGRVGSMWVVEEGLKPGEVVISDGTMKVRDGVAVNAKLENTGTEVGK